MADILNNGLKASECVKAKEEEKNSLHFSKWHWRTGRVAWRRGRDRGFEDRNRAVQRSTAEWNADVCGEMEENPLLLILDLVVSVWKGKSRWVKISMCSERLLNTNSVFGFKLKDSSIMLHLKVEDGWHHGQKKKHVELAKLLLQYWYTNFSSQLCLVIRNSHERLSWKTVSG